MIGLSGALAIAEAISQCSSEFATWTNVSLNKSSISARSILGTAKSEVRRILLLPKRWTRISCWAAWSPALSESSKAATLRLCEVRMVAKYTTLLAVLEGINEIFRGLGVDYIIEGGQTMNPSTEDMLNAIEKVNAKNIFILPNNKNIIMAIF